MSTNETILPWRIAQNVEFTLELPKHVVGGAPVEPVSFEMAPEFGPQSVDLAECENWERISFPMRVAITRKDLGAVVASGAEAKKQLRCVVALLCSASKTRRAVELSYAGEGEWVGELELARSEVAAICSAQARIVRAISSETKIPGIARHRGSLVGESEPVLLILDRWARPYNGPIKWNWAHFSESENAMLRSRAGDLFFIEASGAPTVNLNLDHEQLQPVLQGKEKSGPAALLRNSTAAAVATAAWVQLICTAMLQLARDEETGEIALHLDWRGATIRSAVPLMYPGMDFSTAVDDIYEGLRDSERAPLVLARISAAAQGLAHTGREFDTCATIANRIRGGA